MVDSRDLTDYKGINRNILECKDSSPVRIDQCFSVLIETYWNVKEFYAVLRPARCRMY